MAQANAVLTSSKHNMVNQLNTLVQKMCIQKINMALISVTSYTKKKYSVEEEEKGKHLHIISTYGPMGVSPILVASAASRT